MSPEQATGDKLDGRSDVYSLAAVFYEMIAGEPPITGATKQAIIAKLLTERPTRLSIVRAVPDEVDTAVAKALSKVPADRFATAGAFARALETAAPVTVSVAPRRSRSRAILATLGVGAGIGVVGLAAVLARGKIDSRPDAGITLADRRQLTITGQVGIPAISGDGKALAYRTTTCGASGCTFGVELQDVSSTASRRLSTRLRITTSVESRRPQPSRRCYDQ
jgi:serine/threonine-protein kinase